jgi:hypothetical protein
LEIYAIANNQITNAAFIGTVGFDWQFSGVGNFSGVPGETIYCCATSIPAGWKCRYASTNRRGRRATYPAVCGKRATLSGNADRANQKAAMRAEPNKRLEC